MTITDLEFGKIASYVRLAPKSFHSGDSICLSFDDNSMLQVWINKRKVLVHFANLKSDPVWLCVA